MRSSSTRHPIVLDLSDGASALQLTSRHEDLSVAASAHSNGGAPGTPPGDAEIVAFLAGTLRNPSFSGRLVALIPPLDAVSSCPLRVVPRKNESLEAAILRQAQEALAYPIEEAILDYASIHAETDGERGAQDVLLVSMRKSEMERYVGLARRAGGSLELIEPAATALVRAHSLRRPLGARALLLCHVGRSNTVIAVASAEGLAAFRAVPWGINLLAARLTANLSLAGGTRDADYLLRSHGFAETVEAKPTGVPTGGAVAQILTPLVSRFAHELHAVMGYVRSRAAKTAFSGICLYGPGARVKALDHALSREMNMAAEAVVDPLAQPSAAAPGTPGQPPDSADMALAIGVGIRRLRWL